MTGIRVLDEHGDGPCGFCIHFKNCKANLLACGTYVTYVDPVNAPDWAKQEVGRQPSRKGYNFVFYSDAL